MREPHHLRGAQRALNLAGMTPLPQDGAETPMPAASTYPPETAGALMDARHIAIPLESTVGEAADRIRNLTSHHAEDVTYIYVTDGDGRLRGVVSLRSLLFNPRDRRVSEVMDPNVRSLAVEDDQEEVARRMQSEPYLALPVVDRRRRLVGVIKLREAARVAQAEATEDMRLMVGLSVEENLSTPYRESIRKRLPWLCLNLGTSMLAAVVVGFFEPTISRWTALVVFLPLISAVAGNAGIQGLTVIVRGIALGQMDEGDAMRVLRKEIVIGMVNGFVLGGAIGLIGIIWKGSALLGVVAGAAMAVNQIIGAALGVAAPLIMRSRGIDPALASSIFVTTFTDMLGFLVFLGLAAGAMAIAF